MKDGKGSTQPMQITIHDRDNCGWDAHTITTAAEQGNLAAVKYCVENGRPTETRALAPSSLPSYVSISEIA